MTAVLAVAVVDLVDEVLPVDREVDRLPDAPVVPRLVLARVDRHLHLAECGGEPVQDLEALVALERVRAVDRHGRAVDRVRAQRREPRLLVGDDPVVDRVQIRQRGVPVLGEPRVVEVVVRDVRAVELERPGADPLGGRVDVLVHVARDDRGVPLPREVAVDARVRRLQVEAERPRPLGDGAGDRGHLPQHRDAARQRRVELLLERVDAVVGGERLAVVELDALPERELDQLAVLDLPALREGGVQVEVLVPLQEGLVHRLLRRPRHREDAAEGRDVAGILLERPRDPASAARLRAVPRDATDGRAPGAAERTRGRRGRTQRAALLKELATAELPVEDRFLARLL